MKDLNTYLKSSGASFDVESALRLSVGALNGVSAEAEAVLKAIGIATIFDLAASGLFDAARRIAEKPPSRLPGSVGGDLLSQGDWRGNAAGAADAPLETLRLIDSQLAKRMVGALGTTTLGELVKWPPYVAAKEILQISLGFGVGELADAERPEDLVPVSRRYATERVQYDVIVLDQVLKAAEDSKSVPLRSVVEAGGIDIADIVGAALTAKVAIGAVLTYRQSWFPQGLSLGHLLHSMALAPGESTRIAMVDWTRRVRGQASDNTTQSEGLSSDVTRTRAMGEVTRSVASEAQKGFSGSTSNAEQEQSGQTSGQSSVSLTGSVSSPGLLEAIGNALFGGSTTAGQVGLGTGSTGTSSATSTASTNATGWASSSGERSLNSDMTQNITDRTHQAANSVRNRRAMSITETSQEESERLSTRVVTNYNHMHALTIQYFEVIQIYRVIVELARKTRCLFIPMKLVTFNDETLRRFRKVIAGAGLIPSVRALFWAEPSRAVISAPGKTGPWNSVWLDRNATALGDRLAGPDDLFVVVPSVGLTLLGVGGDVQAKFSELIVELRNGGRLRSSIPERTPADVWGAPGYWTGPTELKNLPAEQVRRLALVRRLGEEDSEGTAQVYLLFDRKLPDGSFASRRTDDLMLLLPVTIKYEKGRAETVAFEIEASLAQEEVFDHLNQNALHYSTAIWKTLDAATITTMLSSYSFGRRPLIEQIDPVPVAVSGNYIVFRSYAEADDKEWKSFLERHDLLNPKPTEDLVPLPSGGVFAEAVLGRSNSAEKIDITRFWNWQDSPIPILPPEISALTAGGKDGNPSPRTGQLEAPVLNIVNPPSLPDPAGLGPLYSAMASGNMFRDMSGFAQVATLAQSALQAAQAGAAGATTAAGTAQQVVATQLTEILKTIAQVATTAMAASAGGLPGGALFGTAAPGAQKQGVPSTVTNAGGLVNHGRAMDRSQSQSNTLENASPARSPIAGLGVPGAMAGSWEQEAMASSLGGGAAGMLGAMLHQVLGAVPPFKPNLLPPPDRWCCALGVSKSIEPHEVGGHVYGSSDISNTGYVYCAKAGILDVGHMRDHIDLTKYVYDAIVSGYGTIPCREGVATLHDTPRDAIGVAQAIAYVDSWAHELRTFNTSQGFSSFSPEDLPSNFLGTFLGARALAVGGSGAGFNAAVDTLLSGLLASLDAQAAGETEKIILAKEGTWFEVFPPSLNHRNFDGRPWFAGVPIDSPPAPAFIDPATLTQFFSQFDFVSKPLYDGTSPSLVDFPSLTTKFRSMHLATGGKDQP